MAADNSHISVGNAIIDMEFSGVVEDREPVRVGCPHLAMPTADPASLGMSVASSVKTPTTESRSCALSASKYCSI